MSEEMKNDSAQTENPASKEQAGESLSDSNESAIFSAEQVEETGYNIDNIGEALRLFRDWKENSISERKVKTVIRAQMESIAKSCEMQDYLILGLFDNERSIGDYHADRIYQGASLVKENQSIYLLLNSMGGGVEPAYLIGKTCQRLIKTGKFVVGVPRRAKSAATLICLGADEIHMGMMSELGPVDPQINNRSVLGLSNAISRIAQINAEHPKTSEMFARYLSREINLIDVGHFERIAESAKQYAERLLSNRKAKVEVPKPPKVLADFLVNHYKDHSFVIDIDEAKELFGSGIVKMNMNEYNFANKVYALLSRLSVWAGFIMKQDIRFVGDMESGIDFNPKRE